MPNSTYQTKVVNYFFKPLTMGEKSHLSLLYKKEYGKKLLSTKSGDVLKIANIAAEKVIAREAFIMSLVNNDGEQIISSSQELIDRISEKQICNLYKEFIRDYLGETFNGD